jgi:hypothetical protein
MQAKVLTARNFEAVFYLPKTGCQWRVLSHDFRFDNFSKLAKQKTPNFTFVSVKLGVWFIISLLLLKGKSFIKRNRSYKMTCFFLL